MKRSLCLVSVFALSLLGLLAGCTQPQSLAPVHSAALHGSLYGGQQPVSGATIQLLAAGSGSMGAASTPLLTVTVTSSDGTGLPDANANAGNANNTLPAGSFRITSDYTCPAAESQVYLLATGGNPGLLLGTNNPALSLMAALGSCGQLSSSTGIQINEVTTAGAVAALAPYMTSYSAIGSTTGAAPTLAQKFIVASEYVNFATGTAPGATLPSNYYASTLELNSLANALAACVNTSGNTGSTSNCGQLFADAKPAGGTAPTDTIGAMLDIVNNPTNNVAAIYNLAAPQSVFAPALTAAPTSWTLPIVPVPDAPYFSPAAGTYAGAQSVNIVTATNGASIYYTTNGSTPTSGSTPYSGPVTVSASQTLKAIAVNRVAGGMSSATYTISGVVATPVISLPSGSYNAPQTITIADATPDATLYYTTNGQTPTTSSAVYTGPLQLRSSETVKAVGIAGFVVSATASQTYQYTNGPTSQTIATFAGEGGNLMGAATQQTFGAPDGVAVDSTGTVYVADGGLNRIFRIDPATGNVTTVAGNGLCCAVGTEGGEAINFGSQEYQVAVDTAGNLYLPALGAEAIYKVTVSTGVITRVAGSPAGSGTGYTGDGGPATSAKLYTPYGVAVAGNGDIFIADTQNNAVRKVTAATGIITTIAGTGTAGFSGDGGLGTAAMLNGPKGVAVDASGDVYIGDTLNYRVRRVSALTGVISTVAGNGLTSATTDGVAATATTVSTVRGIAVDINGNLYIADIGHYRIRLVSASTGLISTIGGTGTQGYTGDGGLATSANIGNPYQLAVDPSLNVYFGDSIYNVTRRIDGTTGKISTIAGTQSLAYAGIGGLAVDARLTVGANFGGVATDSGGNVYYADTITNTIRKITTSTGIMTILAGTGVKGYAGDGGAASSALLTAPTALTIDGSGNLYFIDGSVYVRKIVLSTGVITTVAGGGNDYNPLDSGAGTSFALGNISALATDLNGNLYLADPNDYAVRKLTISTGILSTFAGSTNYGNSGDGGVATSATFEYPSGLIADGLGNLYIDDAGASVVRKVVISTGKISTVAGTGTYGFSGDGGAATSAMLGNSYGLTIDAANNLYIADSNNYRVRKVTVSTGIITTVVGNGTVGYSGDGGQAVQAQISPAVALTLDSTGNLYLLDGENGVIRVIYH